MVCHSVRPLPGYPPVLYQALTEVDLILLSKLKSNNREPRLTKKKKRLVCYKNMIQSRVNTNFENCPFLQLVGVETA